MGDVTKVAHWTYNLDTKELFWSPGMFSLYGRAVSGKLPSWEDAKSLVHPEDREQEAASIEVLLSEGGSYNSEYRIFGEGGRIVSVRGSTLLVKDSQDEPVQLIGVVWDTEEKTRDSLKLMHLEEIQNENDIGFFSFDIENNDPVWNGSTFELLRIEQDQHVPSVEILLNAVDVSSRENLSKLFETALNEGEPFSTCTKLNGDESAIIEIRCKVRKRTSGRISHLYGSIRSRETA
jgi:hypothetical protein